MEGGLDLLNIVLIGNQMKFQCMMIKYELHCQLGTLLSIELTVDEKLGIIKTECHILEVSLYWHNYSNLITQAVRQ